MISYVRVFHLLSALRLLTAPPGIQCTNLDPDYNLEDAFGNLNKIDRVEVDKLLQKYPSNQKLIQSIGVQYYQFINIVQIRHHQIIGLSTREGMNKGTRSQAQVLESIQQPRIGKHYHRTSFLIQAFNHKFRLILELNPTLIAPNLMQKHILNENTNQKERNELESCYYHGIVEGLEWSAAAVRTCNGLSGIIHMGNETFIIHPFYGGDLTHKHPHIIFEATKSIDKQSCGNKGSGNQHYGNFNMNNIKYEESSSNIPKYYIELALLLDKGMFDKREGSTRLQVIHDSLQIINIADLYFRKLNTAISIVYIETWLNNNFLKLENVNDLRSTLKRLTDYYGPRNLFTITKDTTMLLSGVPFTESGISVETSICTPKAMGVVQDMSIYQPHITAVTLAHMIGHNLNMQHDINDAEKCHCPTWYGCIMNTNIIGQDNIQPYIFSDCSKQSYFNSVNSGHSMCLLNRPNAIDPIFKTCGNGVIDSGEECDCGNEEDCQKDPCCERLTCRLKTTSECSINQPCCDHNCKFKKKGTMCRSTMSECDLPEFCNGESSECPLNTFKKNGLNCSNSNGYCYEGNCPTLAQQCENVWDWMGKAAASECFQHLNTGGYHNGHCGRDLNGNYRKCNKNNVMCGTLHCKEGSNNPILSSKLQNNTYTKVILKILGNDYECKSLSGPINDKNSDHIELVRDGTKCDENKICINQTCTSITNYMDSGKCPTNHVTHECSGHGDCSNFNQCHCNPGWEGTDCSVQSVVPVVVETHTTTTEINNDSLSQPGKTTQKQPEDNGSNTIVLVFGMVSVVGGVFIVFAMMALCYRRSTVPKFESYGGNTFNPKNFKLQPNELRDDIDNRIINYTTGGGGNQLPPYREQHSSLGMTTGGSMKNQHLDGMGDESLAFLDGTGGSQSDNNDLCEVERTLKSLNGYHEDILAALRVAAASQGSPPLQSILSDTYPEYGTDYQSDYPLHNSQDSNQQRIGGCEDNESNDGSIGCGSSSGGGGPIRIRNLEDLLRQLEHHSNNPSADRQHLSPCGSEDIRLSETEADRHYLRGGSGGSGHLGGNSVYRR